MGNSVSRALGKLFGAREMKILMLGLDNAGKTTILYKLKLNKIKTSAPTVGFNVETVSYRNVKFNMWDVGGQERLRPLWRHYFPATTALIFVIDSQDKDRIKEAKEELYGIISEKEMENVVLLVWANKQDLKGALKPQEVSDYLQLGQNLKNQLWCVVGSNALTGQGLVEGLSWISNNTSKK
ncbi:ARF3 (YOR094W) [Zygosaccharomyces parabailii]|uniref:ZYBA0S12-01420g1_1 n=1 Tax=Zygosaccharomyces bailii (strain CLIB 213 / ATCC 58445 / CBS 680 / BCRC 21525 / NBRC 1098 / NCYC 1416 / NRRL Y-2227) TaxID=1333698 RepID=A0A8J2TAN3_ZYGB2|nr:ARF3 (YOR094W) [Zygosaccharomyces parabailii]CDF91548.1 ZYBA0S12-01420g1_1 [Zygosaccharomyces bailii CLIB 213]CDH11087.1 ADP-ribosylation factor 3 [Zygosaccharomyces bailii ISA1307]SJM86477.1 ADP-ribosylation factor 3 [Zygosaccharomyces bailii]